MKDDQTYRVKNPQLFSVPRMKSSPRKKSGPSSCSTPVEIFSIQQLNRIPTSELRSLATEKHGIKNARLLKKPDLLSELREHFKNKHGVELKDITEEGGQDVSPISQTIDKLRRRIKVHQQYIFCAFV